MSDNTKLPEWVQGSYGSNWSLTVSPLFRISVEYPPHVVDHNAPFEVNVCGRKMKKTFKDYTDAQEYGELILLRELESAYETLASVNAQRRRKENETKKD